MAYQTINRNSGLFKSKRTIDELNSIIQKIDNKITNFKPTNIPYIYSNNEINKIVINNSIENNSFKIGNLIVLNFSAKLSNLVSVKIPAEITYDFCLNSIVNSDGNVATIYYNSTTKALKHLNSDEGIYEFIGYFPI